MINMTFHNTIFKSAWLSKPLLTVLLMLPLATLQAQGWQGNLGGMIGHISLNDQDWGQQDEHGAIGLLADFRKASWPVSLAFDLIGSGDEVDASGTHNEAYNAALHLGVRKLFEDSDSMFKPYVGGGVALINTEMRTKNTQTGLSRIEEDSATGLWVGAGSYLKFGDNIQVGFDLRYSEATVALFGRKRETGGLQSAVTLGYQW